MESGNSSVNQREEIIGKRHLLESLEIYLNRSIEGTDKLLRIVRVIVFLWGFISLLWLIFLGTEIESLVAKFSLEKFNSIKQHGITIAIAYVIVALVILLSYV